MNPLRLLGHILLWLGFFAGAFFAVRDARLPKKKAREKAAVRKQTSEKETPKNVSSGKKNVRKDQENNRTWDNIEAGSHDDWSLVPWHWYLPSLAVGCFGVVLLRLTQRQASVHSEKLEADIQTLEQRIQTLLKKLANLKLQQPTIAVGEVRHFIDEQLVDDIGDFVEARETLIHTYGLQHYADLMTDFAVAERNINRAWSASADGYIDEVWLSVDRARARLQSVDALLAQYKTDLANTSHN